ncbi:MAG: glycogen/starch/alpha-glucan phosphorylase [Saccharofermentanales bacterium]
MQLDCGFESLVVSVLEQDYGTTLKNASSIELYNAVSKGVLARIGTNWQKSMERHAKEKKALYFSAEFLIGRAIYNNIFCADLYNDVHEFLSNNNIDFSIFEEIEDAALGNGGLGRLAACFLDSAATHDLPLDGYGIRYKFGVFKQQIENGFQIETVDDWQKNGDPFDIRKLCDAVTVRFADQTVMAVPYDMPIIGFGGDYINTLRLWQSEAINCFDFNAFNRQDYVKVYEERDKAEMICAVVYPNDETYEGKKLRLKQQYFFSSASIKDIIRNHKKTHTGFSEFTQRHAIQLNDTHPVVAIPELIRILVAEEGISFDEAFDMAQRIFAYTNHTIMPEALEKWDVNLFRSVLPDVYTFIEKINSRVLQILSCAGVSCNEFCRYSIIQDGLIHMARLAVSVCHSTNGVAAIHTEILKNSTLHEWYKIFPEHFNNKTNGISQRRWLGLCNPELSSFIEAHIGKGFMTDLSDLKRLEKHQSDDKFINELYNIKQKKKEQLAYHIEKTEGIRLDPEFIFDSQIKRFHEYKRQLMNAFSILYIYYGIKEGRIRNFNPTAFIFGGKAASGYFRAKGIIKYINEIAKLINGDNEVKDKLAVVFATNYNVSYAERIIPATDISEQISTAGTEASGTSNMKLMLNGAVTLGTYDGANIEIIEKAGLENNYIFGYRISDIEQIKNCYDPLKIYSENNEIRQVIDTLINGTFNDNGTGVFKDIYNSLLYNSFDCHADYYFLLGDFLPYCEAKLKAINDYSDRIGFTRKCFFNIINAGEFSSDRAVMQYAKEIWGISS